MSRGGARCLGPPAGGLPGRPGLLRLVGGDGPGPPELEARVGHFHVDLLLLHAGQVHADQVRGCGLVQVDVGGPGVGGVDVEALLKLVHHLPGLPGQVAEGMFGEAERHSASPVSDVGGHHSSMPQTTGSEKSGRSCGRLKTGPTEPDRPWSDPLRGTPRVIGPTAFQDFL